MKRVFLDTNVILDLLGERQPYYQSIAQLVSLADKKQLELYCSPLSFATVHYFLAKHTSQAKENLRNFNILCKTSAMNQSIVEKALNASFKDFEDALQYYCALESNCSIIITRNIKDFKLSTLPVMTAEEFIHAELTLKKL